MSNEFDLIKVSRISPPSPHAAFTDLHINPFDKSGNTVLCCYRNAQNHHSHDGQITVLAIQIDSFKVVSKHHFKLANTDLRDPKLSFDGTRLILTCYAKHKDKNSDITTTMLSFFTTTGVSWSSGNKFGQHGWWLWNIAFSKSKAYGLAYNRAANAVNLYSGHPSRAMNCAKRNVFSLEKSGKGYPNESAILFDDCDRAHVFLRRDADSFSAQYGFSRPPYTKWEWCDLGLYIGGPAAVHYRNTIYFVAGRDVDWQRRTFSTAIWTFNSDTRSLTHCLTLPSGGDTSYPGMVVIDKTLYISYYSSHIDNQSRVYLAKVKVVG